jgi:hypothetical protein
MFSHILIFLLLLEGLAKPSPPPEQVRHLAAGVMAMAPRPVEPHVARRLATEVIEVTRDPRYRWLEPVDLLALAAVESDFREHLVAENGKPDPKGWDCGISGVRTPIYFNGRRGRKARRLCNQVAENTALSFEYSARELTNYRNRYCKQWLEPGTPLSLKKCIYNSYKGGPRYSRTSRYWVRHHCYRMGIRLGRRPRRWGWSCRRAESLRWVWKVF